MSSGSFQKHARTVSLLTLVSRVTGLLRDATLSRVFGTGAVLDAFFFAFMIPNLFRRLFGEGALAAAFLPSYSRLDAEDPDQARRLASLVIGGLVTVLGAIVIAGEVVLLVVSSRLDHENLAVWLAMVMLPYMPLVCTVAILGAMLQVHGRFGPTAAAPIVLNLTMIAFAFVAGVWFEDAMHIGAVAAAVVVAGLVQVAWSMRALRDRSWWRRDRDAARDEARAVLRKAVPMIIGLGALQLNTFLDGLIASYPTTVGPTILGVDYPLREGAMTTVSFAQRLYQFPLGVFGIAVATAIFPLLSRQAGDGDAFAETVRRGLRLVVFIGLPASVGLVLVREPLTRVVLEGGAFEVEDSSRVGAVLLGYAPAVWAYSMIHVLTRAFYARNDAVRPVKVAVVMVVLNLVLNCTLIWPLGEAGLAWSTAICAVIQAGVLLVMVRRHAERPVDATVLAGWGRTLVVTAIMGAVVWVVTATLPATHSWGGLVLVLLAPVVAGVAIVAVAAAVLRMPELKWSLGR